MNIIRRIYSLIYAWFTYFTFLYKKDKPLSHALLWIFSGVLILIFSILWFDDYDYAPFIMMFIGGIKLKTALNKRGKNEE